MTGVPRRSFVQGAAWAAPAILVATSAPAAATSLTPGALSLASSSFVASGVNSVLRVVAAHSGAVGTAALTSIAVDITVPSSKVQPAPTVSGTGWVLSAPVTSGSTLIYTATYGGGPVAAGTSASQLSVTFAPRGEDPYPVTATLAGRAVSSTVQVNASATVTRAGEANRLMDITVTRRSGSQHKYVTFTIPAGVTLTDPTLVITWTPSGTGDTNSKVTSSGWARTFTQEATVRTTRLTKAGAVTGTVELDFHDPVAVAGAGNDYTVVLSALVTGSTAVRSRTFMGDYA